MKRDGKDTLVDKREIIACRGDVWSNYRSRLVENDRDILTVIKSR